MYHVCYVIIYHPPLPQTSSKIQTKLVQRLKFNMALIMLALWLKLCSFLTGCLIVVDINVSKCATGVSQPWKYLGFTVKLFLACINVLLRQYAEKNYNWQACLSSTATCSRCRPRHKKDAFSTDSSQGSVMPCSLQRVKRVWGQYDIIIKIAQRGLTRM